LKEEISEKDKADKMEMIEEILASCQVAVTILDDLLAYEKLSSNALKMDYDNVNVHKLIKDCADLFDIQARGKLVKLSVLENSNVIPFDSIIYADAGKITQVLRNFISNAIKFTPTNGFVEITAFESAEGNAVIQVIDSGAGMTPAQVEKIFNEIVQFDVNKLQGGGGSGIGLWISKKIVDVHGGSVRVGSEGRNRGCTFELQLPLVRVRVPEAGARRVHPDVPENLSSIQNQRLLSLSRYGNSIRSSKLIIPTSGDSLAGLHALVVDDSRLNRKFLCRLIRDSCASVAEAEDGVECVSIINGLQIAFDFVLMDVSATIVERHYSREFIRYCL
jgi:CheY-like chemotaxis protein